MKTLFPSPARGSGLLLILLVVVLFAALSYAISRLGSGTKGLSEERERLLASEVIETGTRFAETVSRLRLKGVASTSLSFENTVVAGYANGACSGDSCQVFAFNGGGLDWELPIAGVNGGENWGFSGSVALTHLGTASADLFAVLPNLSAEICTRINVLLGVHDAVTSPPTVVAATFDKFTGSYTVVSTVNSALINGKKSGCMKVTTLGGTAVDGAPLADSYVFFQALQAL